MNTCKIDGCSRRAHSGGFCKSHDRNLKLYGSPTAVRQVQHHGLSTAERFMKYIEKNDDGCWNWTGGVVGKFGHGQFRFGDRSMVASRMSWILFRGEIPSDDSAYGTKHVCHKCDNPKCVNPEHLFLGDNQVNVDDKISKGRHRYGVSLGRAHGNAKLDEAKVRYIRTSELPTSHIARELGIAQATAWAIKNRKAWKHVK